MLKIGGFEFNENLRRMLIVGRTDRGKVRKANEDAHAFDSERGFAVLADGMGGLEAGDVASALAVEVLRHGLTEAPDRSAERLDALIVEANRAIIERARSIANGERMGTTIVVWCATENGCTLAHVGDSRVYRYRDGVLTRLTKDHSVVQNMIDEGVITPDEARWAFNRNVITRALGIEREVEVDTAEEVHEPGDRYLLCSDGLTDLVDDDELARLCLVEPDAHRLVDRFVDAANLAGGDDNITVVLVDP